MPRPSKSDDRDVISFIERKVKKNERGELFKLFEHEREFLRLAFDFDAEGKLPWDTIVYSCPMKSGKTTLNAVVTLWWAETQEDENEVIVCANDFDQAQSRAFRTIARLHRRNPGLGRGAKKLADRITLANGTVIQAIATDYTGAAGSNRGLTSWDELWGYVSEKARRLFEELSPVPTRKNSIRFVTTYAGWEGESDLLMALYKLGVGKEEHPEGKGERIHPDLPIYANREARLLVYWDHQGRAPWQTPKYYAAQKASPGMRPGTYLRLHENRWMTAEERFITPALWDPCVNPSIGPLMPNFGCPLYVGVDAATKHDTAAVVAVGWDGPKLFLAKHRIWKPTPAQPLDLEDTIEAYLRDLHSKYSIAQILCDPWQLHRSITTLQAAGLPIREFPQSTSNTTAMGQNLFELLTGKNLMMYPTGDLRQHALNTVAIENTRGWRIAKEKSGAKIDGIVALAMACLGAMGEAGQNSMGSLISGTGSTIRERIDQGMRDDDQDSASLSEQLDAITEQEPGDHIISGTPRRGRDFDW